MTSHHYPPTASHVGYAHAMADAARRQAAAADAAAERTYAAAQEAGWEDGAADACHNAVHEADLADEHAADATYYDWAITYHPEALNQWAEAATEAEAGS